VEAEFGVYFRQEDYASFWLRVLVDVIDLLVFGATCLALILPVVIILPRSKSTLDLILLILPSVAVSYFVVLKRSRFRTLGYRAGRIRIVGLDSRVPSYLSLILRLMFGICPINWLVDLIWLSNDNNRQALRDKFAGTYVVKVGAQPAGQGRITFRRYSIFYYNWLFREVEAELGVTSNGSLKSV
jgi:uncharacterized RDD family membrane protein YckC